MCLGGSELLSLKLPWLHSGVAWPIQGRWVLPGMDLSWFLAWTVSVFTPPKCGVDPSCSACRVPSHSWSSCHSSSCPIQELSCDFSLFLSWTPAGWEKNPDSPWLLVTPEYPIPESHLPLQAAAWSRAINKLHSCLKKPEVFKRLHFEQGCDVPVSCYDI